MTTSYPGGYDSFTTIGDVQLSAEVGGRTHKEMHNDVNDAVEAIQAELGLDPAGAYATVKARLDATAVAADYAALAGATFTGAVVTAASASGGAGFRLPHGTAPSSPTNGDVWTTTSGLLARINGNTRTMATTSDLTAYAALAGATFTGAVMVDGTASAIQLRVQGHSTQAFAYQTWERSTGVVVAQLAPDGNPDDAVFGVRYLTNAANGGPFLDLTGTSVVARNRTTTTNPVLISRGMASQTGNGFEYQNSSSTVLAAITSAGLHKWSSGNEQTTVGAAGAASALPATPTKFLKIVDSAGTTLVIPAYAAS